MFETLKVLELASVLAGPSVGQFFAELGAEVIKVENIHTSGDVTRTWRVKGEQTDDRSSYFCSVNWGKKSIAIDLNTKDGRAIVYELSQKSDVVITSYKSGDAAKLGVDYSTLSSINKNLIYGQITGYGSDNPRVGYDAVIQAEAGFIFMNGETNGASLKMPVALMDILAAHHLKEGILIALLNKGRTGKGGFIEVSLIQAAIASLANQASNWLVANTIPQKQGSAHPNITPYGDIFRTADAQEILLAIGTDRQFKSLCSILELSDALLDQNYSTNESRVRNRDTLNHLLANKIESMNLAVFVAALNQANLPYGIIKNMKDVFEMPEAMDLLIHAEDRIGVKSYVGQPSLIKNPHFLPPPHFGEHTLKILSKSLAMSPERIQSLAKTGIIL